ncbi:O-acetylhomoserine aminocarboxypropyltransferase/cysteine synthase [Desulfurispirillum indicum]|uniref:O-succinylhomoserine sulfhydrylase n=1 Tax=Desulfurispirillum indicum (strain ATCC BAA-1389 / DSM 22839 / S5) TaxID=653733 RepID=E6W4N6_DESIS|nr:O-acetylhomoserine aminocarboxypropyltransferase/cysteine synthase family protein [Desulfurispirillum indicum]ADU67109.1 O-acetylhomoserine/O-acetylserine sulfhydrylase [Desulfurispirillum indicum S5]UCZ56433.1 O-acetylhomoserine aminocarboxypropyltransferase/cysteine synthase [Desulfurispirillum indicum]
MKHIESQLLHGGYRPDHTGACIAPLYQTAAYEFKSPEHAANLFDLKEFGFIYSRINNPTQEVLEKRVAAVSKGTAALALSSGMSAIMLSILNIARCGQNIVSTSCLYGGTYNLFRHTFARMGIEVRFVDSSNPENYRRAADENTRAFYMESIGNPGNNVDDMDAIAAIAHELGLPLIVDNTVSPIIFQPFDHGADIAVYSTTKYMSGNGSSIGGVIVEKGDFPWNNGRFAEFTEPDPSYHGVQYWSAFGDHDQAAARGMAFCIKARVQLLRDMGCAIAPFNAFLTMEGMESLPLRMEKHTDNALKVARFLENHPAVNWVNYPGLPSHRDHQRAQAYLDGRCGGVIGFGIKGGLEAGKRFLEKVQMIIHLVNIGDARTVVSHPASTTHRQMTTEERRAAGISDDYIRLSIGIENVDDIIADIEQALQ